MVEEQNIPIAPKARSFRGMFQRIKAFAIRREHLSAAFILLIALIVFYRDVVFGGRTFLMLNSTGGTMPLSMGGGAYGSHDPLINFGNPPVKDPGAIAWANEPTIRNAEEIISEGELPLWNAHGGLGSPFLVDGNAAPLEPIQMLFYLFPIKWWPISIDLQVLLRFLLAGFFTYLFVREIGLSFSPAIFAGISYMLASYFVVYGNHPQMRAEVLLPILLYCYERLFKLPSLRNAIAISLMVYWVIISSFPQSGFMSLLMSNIWYLYRLAWKWIWEKPSFQQIRTHVLVYCAANLLGIGLCGFYILPLVENINGSLSAHDKATGLASLPQVTMYASLLPRIFTTLWWAPHFYIIPISMSIFACISMIKLRPYRGHIGFFGLYGAVLYMKMYGVSIVQWIGLLPVINQVGIYKYSNPSVSMCVAVLGAFGLHIIFSRQSKAWHAIIPPTLFGALFIWLNRNAVSFQADPALVWRLSLIAFAMVVVSSIAAFMVVRLPRHVVGFALCLLVLMEAVYWHRWIVRPERYDPYTISPFVALVKDKLHDDRVIGFDGIIYPEISSAYKIDDVRFMSALLSKRRFMFISEFLAPGANIYRYLLKDGEYITGGVSERISNALSSDGVVGDKVALINEFTRLVGSEYPYYLGKYFDLLNVQYILTTPDKPPLDVFNLLLLPYTDKDVNRPPLVQPGAISLDGVHRQALFLHPPSRIAIPFIVPAGQISLRTGFGFDPSLLMAKAPHSDGVTFHVSVTDGTGEHQLVERNIVPTPGMVWQDVELDLSRWSGQRVTISFFTDGGPVGDNSNDWAYFSVPVIQIHPALMLYDQDPSLQSPDRLALILPLLEQNFSSVGPGFGSSSLSIGNDRRVALFMHPDNRADLSVNLSNAPTKLAFGIGMDPHVWAEQIVGDGVTFEVDVIDSGAVTKVYNRYIDPKNDISFRRWLDEQIDLTPWSGKSIMLRFKTSGGPKGNNAADWSYWADIKLEGVGVASRNRDLNRFSLVQDGDVQVYRNNTALPRTFVVHQLKIADNADTATRLLANADINLTKTAVVEIAAPTPLIEDLTRGYGDTPFSPATIIKRTANQITIKADLDSSGVLVVSEATNPGWKVYVDGKRETNLIVNVFLQGVYLGVGSHTVEYIYSPDTFLYGLIVTAASVVIILAAILNSAIAKRRNIFHE